MSFRGFGALQWSKAKIGAYAAAFVTLAFLMWPVGEARIRGYSSAVLLSSEGVELRHFRERSLGAYSEWVSLSEYPEHLIRAVLEAEDGRFYYHPGFDPLAFGRAVYQNLRSGRVVSGGSTITQQLVRIAYASALPKNDYLRKALEIGLALRVTLQFSKDEILEAYLNRIPLKYNRMGMAAGSRGLFGKTPALLSKEESLALTVLIRQSHVSDPVFRARYRNLYKRLYGEAQSLNEGHKEGHDEAPEKELDEELLERISAKLQARASENSPEIFTPARAPHFVEWFEEEIRDFSGALRTEISSNLSLRVSEIVNAELAALGQNEASNAAVVVLELAGDKLYLRALVGSRDFMAQEGGQVNGALAIRTAGSSLKPFIYGEAFESLGYRSYQIIEDSDISIPTEVPGETYRPRNYDLNFWGAITVREALATSRNIPAIKLAEEIGLDQYFELLRELKIDHMKNSPSYYGPGAALGTIGVSLLDLTRAYSVFPAGGALYPLVLAREEGGAEIVYGEESSVFSEETAAAITHILSDSDIRRKAFGRRSFLDFPFEAAAKTGTSKDYRDSWTVGYTSRYVVGVWVGNFSGEEMRNISGVFGAGRIFQQTMRLFYEDNNHEFRYPDGASRVYFCRISGRRAGELCPAQEELVFEEPEKLKSEICKGDHSEAAFGDSPRITSPVNGEVFLIDPHSPPDHQQIPVSLREPQNGETHFQIDGGPREPYTAQLRRLIAPARGEHRVVIYRGAEAVEEVRFEVR